MKAEKFAVRCPFCQRRFRCYLRNRGKSVKCPWCFSLAVAPICLGNIPVEAMPLSNLADWQKECETAIIRIGYLLTVAKEQLTGAAVVEMVRHLPRTTEELDQLSSSASLLWKCLQAMMSGQNSLPMDEMVEIGRFLRHVASMPTDNRILLEASIVGVIVGLETPQ